MKSTAGSGVKQSLKPCAYKRSEPPSGVTACLLHNEPTSCPRWPAKRDDARSLSESESEEGALWSAVADAKPGDLPLPRLKSR